VIKANKLIKFLNTYNSISY